MIIRTFEIDRRTGCELGVGGGITADSVPIREWYECLHKAAPLVGGRAAAGSTRRWPTSPDRPTADAGRGRRVRVDAGRRAARSSGWPGTWPGWTGPCRELYGLGLPADLAGPAAGAPADGPDAAERVGPAGRGAAQRRRR